MMISIGYRNYISVDRIVAIISPDSRPTKNMINGARENNKIVDATMGKKTKSVIVTNSNHVVLSANSPDTIVHRTKALGMKLNFGEDD
ncbi:hypothetical protein B6I21_01835 [candidate division KSB1 bacterium 4572_119]|nr:MAG: hypothetical protein B6I21_01835 [candidate division KSB1 bacterium 4572_119]